MNVEAGVARGPSGIPERARPRGATTPKEKRNAFIASFLGWGLDGFETYTVVLVGHQVTADLIGPHASPIFFGSILAITLFAWACGGMLSGVVSDYLGRKKTLMVSILWYAVFTGLSAISPNFAVFMLLRFFAGLGLGAEWGPGSALVSEIWSDRSRGRGIALLQGGFGVGFLVATGCWAFVNTGPHAWRYMFLIGVIPAFCTFFIWRYARDPQLWIDADRRRAEARARKAAGRAAQADDEALNRLTFLQVFQDPTLRGRTLKLLVLAAATLIGWWATSSYVPVFAAEVAHKAGQHPAGFVTTVALCYNGGAVVGYLAMGWLNDTLGRRWTIWGFFLGALIMDPILFLVAGSMTWLPFVAAVNGFFTLGIFTWMATWPVELYPTYARATGITIVFNATRYIAATFAVISGILVATFGSVATAAVVIGSVYVVGVLLTFWVGPETKGIALPN
jgi:MFS family permease